MFFKWTNLADLHERVLMQDFFFPPAISNLLPYWTANCLLFFPQAAPSLNFCQSCQSLNRPNQHCQFTMCTWAGISPNEEWLWRRGPEWMRRWLRSTCLERELHAELLIKWGFEKSNTVQDIQSECRRPLTFPDRRLYLTQIITVCHWWNFRKTQQGVHITVVKSQGPDREDWKANCVKVRSALLMIRINEKVKICETRTIHLEHKTVLKVKQFRDKLMAIVDNKIQKWGGRCMKGEGKPAIHSISDSG